MTNANFPKMLRIHDLRLFVSLLTKIATTKRLLRLSPFDLNSEEGRSNERHRRLLLSALGNGVAKLISIVTMLVSVPLTLNYLGTERYGLWMIISSVIAMLAFADFGIGNGLMNAVAESEGKSNRHAMRSYISSAFVVLSSITLLLLGSFFLVYPHIEWAEVFKVRSPIASNEAGPALAVFVVCFLLSIPAGIVQRVQLGLQKGFENSFWLALGSVLGLLLTLVAIRFETSLLWLVAAMAGGPLIASFGNAVWFFLYKQRELFPNIKYVTRLGITHIGRTGALFFFLQIAVAVAYSSDNIIIARVLGPESVTEYSIISRMFEAGLILIGLVFAPLWPAYAEATARGDRVWVRNTLLRSMKYTLLLAIGMSSLLVILSSTIFNLWIGEQFNYSFTLVVAYGGWAVLKGLGTTYAMFINGISLIRMQLIVVSIFLVTSIFAKILLTQSIGVVGLPVALIATYFVFVVLPYAALTPRILSMGALKQ